jgi:hypothetical protein
VPTKLGRGGIYHGWALMDGGHSGWYPLSSEAPPHAPWTSRTTLAREECHVDNFEGSCNEKKKLI